MIGSGLAWWQEMRAGSRISGSSRADRREHRKNSQQRPEHSANAGVKAAVSRHLFRVRAMFRIMSEYRALSWERNVSAATRNALALRAPQTSFREMPGPPYGNYRLGVRSPADDLICTPQLEAVKHCVAGQIGGYIAAVSLRSLGPVPGMAGRVRQDARGGSARSGSR